MKTQSKEGLVSVVTLVTMILGICIGSAQDSKAPKISNLEQTQGEVRVVLLRAGHMASTNESKSFVVTYAVEVPKKGAFSDLHFTSADEITLSSHGETIGFHAVSSKSVATFKDLPRQSELIEPVTKDGKAMLSEDIVFKDISIGAKQIDIKVQFSWRGQQMSFDFKDVPVN